MIPIFNIGFAEEDSASFAYALGIDKPERFELFLRQYLKHERRNWFCGAKMSDEQCAKQHETLIFVMKENPSAVINAMMRAADKTYSDDEYRHRGEVGAKGIEKYALDNTESFRSGDICSNGIQSDIRCMLISLASIPSDPAIIELNMRATDLYKESYDE